MHPRFSMWWISFLPVKKKWISVTFWTRLEFVLDILVGCPSDALAVSQVFARIYSLTDKGWIMEPYGCVKTGSKPQSFECSDPNVGF